MALAAGGRLLYAVLNALDAVGHLEGVAHTPAGITHGAFLLSEAQEQDFAKRSVTVPDAHDLPRIKEAATGWLNSLRASGKMQSEAELLAKIDATAQEDLPGG